MARTRGAGRRRTALRWLGDAAALLPLVVVLPWLASLDGGRGLAGTWPLALACVVALPVAWSEVRRLPRVAVVLLAMWGGALVLGVVASRYRADMVVPLLQYTIAPVLLLATRRVWRRSWGPAALLGILGVAVARYQIRSWMDWWAQTEGGTGYWRPLSWRNPSAALTGMFGVWFLGTALMSRRLVRIGLGLLAATAFAGTWLSSSRAGLVVTAGAMLVVVAVGVRAARVHGRTVLAPLATAGAVVLVTAVTVAGLLSMQPAGTAQAVASRDQSVEQNTLARIEHSEAALGMFLDRPWAGQGLGSYKSLAREWNDPEGNLTSSAHDEYAEVAGETGILGRACPPRRAGWTGVDGSGGAAPTAPPRLVDRRAAGPRRRRHRRRRAVPRPQRRRLRLELPGPQWDGRHGGRHAAARPGWWTGRGGGCSVRRPVSWPASSSPAWDWRRWSARGPAPWQDATELAAARSALDAGRPERGAARPPASALAWNPASPDGPLSPGPRHLRRRR